MRICVWCLDRWAGRAQDAHCRGSWGSRLRGGMGGLVGCSCDGCTELVRGERACWRRGRGGGAGGAAEACARGAMCALLLSRVWLVRGVLWRVCVEAPRGAAVGRRAASASREPPSSCVLRASPRRDLHDNSLSGAIPTQLGLLTQLEYYLYAARHIALPVSPPRSVCVGVRWARAPRAWCLARRGGRSSAAAA